jgi:hypothetical protein
VRGESAGPERRSREENRDDDSWSRELGLELPTPSIMHACLSVRREFRHLLTRLRIRNAGTREPGSHARSGEARATPPHRRVGPRARARGAGGAHPAGRDRYRPRCARRGRHVTAAVHPSSSRPGPLIALNTGRMFTAYRHLRGHLRISEGSRWNRRQASRIQRVGLSL